MNYANFFFALTVASVLTACGSRDTKPTAENQRDPKATEMIARISTMEDTLFKKVEFEQRRGQELLDVYKAYAAAFPLDDQAPEYLFRAAGLSAKAMGDAEQGIKLYDRIINDYPSWTRIPDTYYLKAFTIDTELNQKGEAQKAYQQVINLYPEHPFAKDARQMMEYLNMTDEELIKKFEAMEKAQDAATN